MYVVCGVCGTWYKYICYCYLSATSPIEFQFGLLCERSNKCPAVAAAAATAEAPAKHNKCHGIV